MVAVKHKSNFENVQRSTLSLMTTPLIGATHAQETCTRNFFEPNRT